MLAPARRHIVVRSITKRSSIFRRHLASGRNANGPAVRLAGSTADDGDDVAAFDADEGLEHHGAGRVLRLHRDHHLDRVVPHDKHNGAEVQAGLERDLWKEGRGKAKENTREGRGSASALELQRGRAHRRAGKPMTRVERWPLLAQLPRGRSR